MRNGDLAKKITINSNNQNAIKARDLRSNHVFMLRLRAEFEKSGLPYSFEIKRGEIAGEDKTVITNEDAGRMLLAFDLDEPYSAHQIYKGFDDKYAEIFGRPEVDAWRVAFVHQIMEAVTERSSEIESKQVAAYRLTRYLLLHIVGQMMRSFDSVRGILSNKNALRDEKIRERLLARLPDLLGGLMVDFNYELEEAGEGFDYKAAFKSPDSVKTWTSKMMKSYQKDLARGKAESLEIEGE